MTLLAAIKNANNGTVFRFRLPAPRQLLLLVIDCTLEPELLEVLLEGLICPRIRQDLQVDHVVRDLSKGSPPSA